MKIIIELPEEFRDHYEMDKFEDSLCRILSVISQKDDDGNYTAGISGLYEEELIDVLIGGFKNSEEIVNITKVNEAKINNDLDIQKVIRNYGIKKGF